MEKGWHLPLCCKLGKNIACVRKNYVRGVFAGICHKLVPVPRKNGRGNNSAKICFSRKKIFFSWLKNFPQEIENTREIIENMSEIF